MAKLQIDITTPANVDHDAVRDGMLIGARVASGQGNEQSASSKGDRTSGVGTVATPRFSTQEVEDIINIHFQFLHNVKKDETTSGQIPSKEPCTIEFSIDTDTKQIYGEEAPGSPTGAGQRSGHPFGVSSRRINYEFERFCIWMNANLTASEIENGTVGIIILDKDDPAWSAETEDRNLLFVTKASPSTSITKTVTSATTLRLIAKVSGSAKYNLTGKYRRQTG